MAIVQDIPPRLYQGPRQEKQYRKNQRQLLQREQEVLAPETLVQDKHKQLVAISKPVDIPRIVLPKSEPRTNYALVIPAYCLGIVGLGINGWFAWSRGTALIDKVLFSAIGFFTEAVMFFLLSQAKSLWQQRQWGSFLGALILWPLLFAFALTNSLGFASQNLTETTTARAERVTPAIVDAQRKLDTLSASRNQECIKRGDRCRQLEKDEQTAIESLKVERDKVSSTSDPQITSAAKLVAWVSLDRFHPSADDFAMLRLLLLTLLPQLGGLVLMVATKR
jgi:hypothetical protein